MTDQEKKAIEEFKKLKNYKQTYYGNTWFTVEVCADDEMKQNIDIISNLIEKQSKEIEELKEKYSKKLIEFQKEREWYEKNYISKNKIKEKIKKYDKWLKNTDEYKESLEAQRYALNDLLKED